MTTPGTTGLVFNEGLLNALSRAGGRSASLPARDVPPCDAQATFGALLRRTPAALPEMSEPELVRHFTRLSATNYNIDSGFFPLGSCTMKHNPRVNEHTAALQGFANLHPLQDPSATQGALQLIMELESYLAAISGMDAVSSIPAAGSHGELAGLMMIRAYLRDQGDVRKTVLIPDSAHGTNPASAAICGYNVIEIQSGPDGTLQPEAVAEAMRDDVAALMITNPNTLGIFEPHIESICEIVHARGGLVYCDGANLNALMGKVQIGHTGCDVMHFNLHKTFTTPHGGGGPGSGPVGCTHKLTPYLPIPRIVVGEKGQLQWSEAFPSSIGRIKAFFGNFGMFVRAYTYIREMGGAGLTKATEHAVVNANYLKARLRTCYHLAYDTPSLHEFVLTNKRQKNAGVRTEDIAKRLLDYGFHPPTVYFPLLVHDALMVEPTETESKFACDQFVEAMQQISNECENTPDIVKSAPTRTFRRRLDAVKASRKPILRWHDL